MDIILCGTVCLLRISIKDASVIRTLHVVRRVSVIERLHSVLLCMHARVQWLSIESWIPYLWLSREKTFMDQ